MLSVVGRVGTFGHWLWPETNMDDSRFLDQHGTNNLHRLDRPAEKIATWDEEIRTRKHRKLVGRESVDQRAYACPVDLADTHRTWLTTGIENRTPDLIARQLSNRGGHKVGFGVSSGISIGRHRVRRGQNYIAVDDKKSAERFVTVAAGLRC